MVSEKRIHDRIVVGVDGSTASHQAVMWAAAEARLRHADLIVTHVEPAGSGAGWTQDRADVDRHELLAASATAASTRQPGV
ncbi:MAG: universal stress protein, partial [Propionibacteriaceae bacterium]